MLPLQTLADRRLHSVRDSLLRVRHIRHVPVPLAQAAGQRSRGGWPGVHGGRGGGFPAQRDADGAASHLHGDLLLPHLSGNYDNTVYNESVTKKV